MRPLALVAIGLLGAGCRDADTVVKLTGALSAEFAPMKVGVSMTDGVILTVKFANSRLAVASCEEQVAIALNVGRYLHDEYTGLGSLQVVNVAFGQSAQDATVEIPLQKAHLPIRLNPAVVANGLLPEDSTNAVYACKAFEELNQ